MEIKEKFIQDAVSLMKTNGHIGIEMPKDERGMVYLGDGEFVTQDEYSTLMTKAIDLYEDWLSNKYH